MTESFSREEILSANPLVEHLERHGIKLRGSGDKRTANQCPAVAHKKDHWCVSIDGTKNVWRCNDCDIGGSVIDWIMTADGKTAKEVIVEMASRMGGGVGVNGNGAAKSSRPEKIVATYDYADEQGRLIYQVVRFDPKTFRQRQPDGSGGWSWSMDGVTRILYRLADVLLAPLVVCCEGEKDCDALRTLGWTATCNVGGAGKWLSAYSETLKGKDVIIIPDNDPPGEKHGADIIASLKEKAGSVKLVAMPAPHKDASDYIATFQKPEDATRALQTLFDRTPHVVNPIPVFTMTEMAGHYHQSLIHSESRSFSLGNFLPGLASIRRLVPGELVLIVGNTATGKTLLLQLLARSAYPLPTLMFELELPGPLLFERFMQAETGSRASEVEDEFREQIPPVLRRLRHILVCAESGLTTDQIETYICRSELKIGQRPLLVLVDYIGLVKSIGKSRYEQASYAAEQMKVIAKRTGTIIIMASQISRKDKDKKEESIGLHDAKDSGSMECSAGVVIGAWRPEKGRINLKILKNTRGTSGQVIECDFNGATMTIKERPLELTKQKPAPKVAPLESDTGNMSLPYRDS